MKHMEVLAWERIGNADSGSPVNHTCQPISDWNDDRSNTVSLDIETELASQEKMSQRKSGFAASTMLLNAIVARYFLVQRRKGILEGHNDSGDLHSFFQKFQEDTGLVISRDRYERACLVSRAVLEAFPTPAICSHTFGIWCVGQFTKALPNSLRRLVLPNAAPPMRDPLETWWQTFGKNTARRCGYTVRFLSLMVLVILVIQVMLPAVGPISLVCGLWGPSWFARISERYRSEGVPTKGYISDRIIIARGQGFCARYYWNRHACTLITFIEDDGGVFVSSVPNFLQTFETSKPIISMLKLPNAIGSSFPTESLSKGRSYRALFKQIYYILIGLFITYQASQNAWRMAGWGATGETAVLVVVLMQLMVVVALWKMNPPCHFGYDLSVVQARRGWKGTLVQFADLFVSKLARGCWRVPMTEFSLVGNCQS